MANVGLAVKKLMNDLAAPSGLIMSPDRREYTMDDAIYSLHKHDKAIEEVREFHKLILKEISRW